MKETYKLSFKDDSGQGYAVESRIIDSKIFSDGGEDAISFTILEIENNAITTAKGQCLKNILGHQLRPLIKLLISVERMMK
tara:strand:- start:266 stop:508 length:243 start_codon:yes stop_codon:yes gene_type:complete